MERLLPDDSSESGDSDSDDSNDSHDTRRLTWTPLMTLILSGDISNAQRLIESGTVDIEEKDSDGDTALYWSMIQRQEYISAKLIAAGADLLGLSIDHNRRSLNEALLAACLYANMPCIQACLEKGANINYSAPIHGRTPLIATIQSVDFVELDTSLAVAKYLISKGADITAVDAKGKNAVVWVAARCSVGIPEWMSVILAGTFLQPKIKESRAAKMFQALWRGFHVRQKRRSCDLGAWKVRKFGSGFMYTFVFNRPVRTPTEDN
jgi:hypothetical protein